MTQQVIVVHQRRRASCRVVACILASTLVFITAFSVFVFGIVAIVNPHMHENDYKSTTCNTTSLSWGDEYLKCNCHTEYDDKEICTEGQFPCLNIKAEYKDESGMKRISKVYHTYSGMQSDPMCSYPACNAYDRSNEYDIPGAQIFIRKNNEVKDYASEHSPGSLYSCFYDPSDYTKVITSKEYTTMDAFNITFWPLLVIILTIVLTVVVVRMCRRNDQRNGVEFNRFY